MHYHPQTNCVIFDFNRIRDIALQKGVDQLLSLGLIEVSDSYTALDIGNRDVRNVLYHYVILELCETVVKCDIDGFRLVHFNNDQDINYLTRTVEVNEKKTRQFVNKLILGVANYLPINLYHNKLAYNKIITFLTGNSGETEELVNSINNAIGVFDPSSFRLIDIEEYLSRYKLNYLVNQYFRQNSTKNLFYRR